MKYERKKEEEKQINAHTHTSGRKTPRVLMNILNYYRELVCNKFMNKYIRGV